MVERAEEETGGSELGPRTATIRVCCKNAPVLKKFPPTEGECHESTQVITNHSPQGDGRFVGGRRCHVVWYGDGRGAIQRCYELSTELLELAERLLAQTGQAKEETSR